MKGYFVLILSMYECETIILCELKVSGRGILSIPENYFLTKELQGPKGYINQRCY